MAIRVWNALADGHGGIHWAGLELMVAWLDIDDVEGLLQRLLTIKAHRASADAHTAAPTEET